MNKHQWDQITIEDNEKYICKNCGIIVTITYLVDEYLYKQETCPNNKGEINAKSNNR